MKTENMTLDTVDAGTAQFLNDVISGLGGSPKELQSKYFYDQKGDELFQQIMAMPEYYLTNCEMEIFRNRTPAMAGMIHAHEAAFDLIELGPGDAQKSIHLLRYLVERDAEFSYVPIDISGHVLQELEERLGLTLPGLDVSPLEGEYLPLLERASDMTDRRKVVLFLGSSIGNMEWRASRKFCEAIYEALNPGDLVLMGFDLRKHPQTILTAYQDPAGMTAAFNLNLLARINRELGGDFDPDHFEHYASYDPVSGACRSFLVSLKNQQVGIAGKDFLFKKNEIIKMEISQKYSMEEIDDLGASAGFQPLTFWKDSQSWFVDVLWQR